MLKIENLSVDYGNISALRGVSLEVKENQIVSLIGANGAGKSTLFLNLNGVLQTSAGEILLDGAELLHADRTLLRQGKTLPGREPAGSCSGESATCPRGGISSHG